MSSHEVQAARGPDDLLPEVYDQLRRLARNLMHSERVGHTLEPTALVHEAFLRLRGQSRAVYNDSRHFYRVAVDMIIRVLKDYARRHKSKKRFGNVTRHELDERHKIQLDDPATFLSIHGALEELALERPRWAEVVKLRIFGALTKVETAEVLGVSRSTVATEWKLGLAWLNRSLEGMLDGLDADERSPS